MVGIDNLKEAILVGIKIGQTYKEASADGKITWMEAVGSIPKLAGIVKIARNAYELKKEFLDLDAEEVKEISEFVTKELDLSDNVEEWINYSFVVISSLLDFPK